MMDSRVKNKVPGQHRVTAPGCSPEGVVAQRLRTWRRGCAATGALNLQLAHGVREHPEGAVELHVLVDAGDRPRRHRAPGARASV